MGAKEFLLEIGTEEIPAWMIEAALADLRRLLLDGFQKLRLAAASNIEVETYATPRRLVAYSPEVPPKQPDTEELLTGPPKAAPPQAAESFALKMGADVSRLTLTTTPKGEYWAFHRKQKGRSTKELLAALLPEVVLGIYFPKTMYWTDKNGPRFIRPIRSLLALYAGRVVPFSIAGVASGRYTFGHRSLGKSRLKARNFAEYEAALRKNGVVLKPEKRRQKILAEADALLGREADEFRLRDNPELLNTLVYLTEFATAAMGQFNPSFLEIPEEVLVTVMQHHQKYLSVSDAGGRLAPRFIFVMNLDGDPTGAIRHGNERVLRARFTDARFFWETDQKIPLRNRLPMLEHVTFQAKLGSYRAKSDRIVATVRKLAADFGADQDAAVRAAELAKCDLTTELVKEFTELQGIVGGLYARVQGESEKVAAAIYEHYQPQSMDEESPKTPEGAVLSVADKMDTLAGFSTADLLPSGSKDPFALRRAAQGVVKILADRGLHVTLRRLIEVAVNQYPDELREGSYARLFTFFKDRLAYFLREIRGFKYDEVNAVLAVGPYDEASGKQQAGADDVADALARCAALARVRSTENFEPLSVAFKRIKNILTKAGGVDRFTGDPDTSLLEPGAEADLYAEARRIFAETQNSTDYEAVLRRTADLRPFVDTYFDKVLVMAPDEAVRRNRLTLLAWLLRAFTRVADFSEVVVGKEENPTS